MFNKILIANRGEIVGRIIRTAKRLGISTVAIYSAADRDALHVKLADEAYYVGPAPSRDSYLQYEKIIAIALKAKVQAIHPGYGFLSENADFARRCQESGLIFIGPTPEAIQAMGSKSAAKALMTKIGVPVTPGYHGEQQDLKTFEDAAKKIGYPVLLKAAAGGGGKGMRTVWHEAELADALASAKREALASFSDDTMLVEKYLQKPRHIEIQIFADQHNNYVYLFERDCSIQRRHQKIIEEAPAPHISDETRKQMGLAAIKAAQAINYVGAGTVEFLYDAEQKFYFMEMNTRLQVEHPVTEMITGLDLVEWQFLVADKQKLPLTQEQIPLHGHAIETRIYAEDPNKQFLPATGLIKQLYLPTESTHVRVDSAVTQGDRISPYYDPMIAKLIVWANTRAEAITTLRQALANFTIIGLTNNIPLLQNIIAQPDYINAHIDTDFIAEHGSDLFNSTRPIPSRIHALACLYLLLRQQHEVSAQRCLQSNTNSPWFDADHFRLNIQRKQAFRFLSDQNELTVTAYINHDCKVIYVNDDVFNLTGQLISDHKLQANFISVETMTATVFTDMNIIHLIVGDEHFQVEVAADDAEHENQAETSGSLNAPMPGTVVALLAQTGKTVTRGDRLMVIEAMKMEHTILAPADGTIKTIHYKVGDMVDEGAELLTIE